MAIKEHFDELYTSWNELSIDDKERAEFISANIPKEVKVVLDAGCGNGLVSKVVSRNFDVTGLELSEIGAKKMVASGLKCLQGSIADMPFENKSFDMVLVSEVIEHLDEELFLKALHEITRVTRDYILITVPNNENLRFFRRECPQCKSISVPWSHLRSFSQSKAQSLFNDFGFNCLDCRVFGPARPNGNHILSKILKFHSYFSNTLIAGTKCAVCGYAVAGLKPQRNMNYLINEPGKFLTLGLDRVYFKLAPKIPRWIFALYKVK
jgi:SAM-dependent methyltransferase